MAACAQPAGNAELTRDPTGTRTLRQEFLREVARRFRRLRGLIRSLVGYENDALHLMQEAPGSILTANQEDRDRFTFTTRENLEGQFMHWLRERIREEILEPVSQEDAATGEHWTAPYVRSGYISGWQQATGRLMQEGVSVDPAGDVQAILQLPVTKRQLRRLYTRAFENLRSITEDMAPAVRRVLTEGLDEGWNPKKMARRLTSEVEDIEATRARTLARTEVIHSHSKATLDRFERAGVSMVHHGEWSTADDSRVCPICETLEGRVMTIAEMRTGTFEFEPDEDQPDSLGGTYPLLPPAHPNGRCSISPVVGLNANVVVANAGLEASAGVRNLAAA